MIGFRNNRPLLKLGDCLITEYGEQWLADALEHAARRAGTTLPFKDDLLASVRYYLEHECDLSVMQVSELYERLRRMLTEVGRPGAPGKGAEGGNAPHDGQRGGDCPQRAVLAVFCL